VWVAFVLLLTPTGTLPSPRWRWWAGIMVAAPAAWLVSKSLLPRPLNAPFQSVANPFAVHVLVVLLTVVWRGAAIVMSLGLVAAVASLMARFRRAHGTERQQLRWVALAAWLSVAMLAVALAGQILGNDAVVTWASGALVAILPLATGAAILRYRLYELDRIISRTLAYGLLTVLLGLGYAAVVLGLGRPLPQGSSLDGGKPHPGAGPGDQGDLAGEVVGRVHGCLLLFRPRICRTTPALARPVVHVRSPSIWLLERRWVVARWLSSRKPRRRASPSLYGRSRVLMARRSSMAR
jgi:hypothetical protein